MVERDGVGEGVRRERTRRAVLSHDPAATLDRPGSSTLGQRLGAPSGSRGFPVAASQRAPSCRPTPSRPWTRLGSAHRVHAVGVPFRVTRHFPVAASQTRARATPSRPWTRRGPAHRVHVRGVPLQGHEALPRGRVPDAPSCRTTPSRPWTRRGSSTPTPFTKSPSRVRASPWPRPRRRLVATLDPSGLQHRLHGRGGPFRVTRHSPVAASQTRTVVSSDPVTTLDPPLQHTECTVRSALHGHEALLVAASQTRRPVPRPRRDLDPSGSSTPNSRPWSAGWFVACRPGRLGPHGGERVEREGRVNAKALERPPPLLYHLSTHGTPTTQSPA